MKYFWTRFLPSYPKVLLYMLQDTEYRYSRYIEWYRRTDNFRTVIKRRQLTMTNKVWLLLLCLWLIWLAVVLLVIQVVFAGITVNAIWFVVAAGLFLLIPFIQAYGILIPLVLGWIFIQKRKERQLIQNARLILVDNPAIRIGIAGSYGKTTAKELLKAVLSEGKNTAATPGNMNTPIGISRFVRDLTGDEEILIFELGEEKVGDVEFLSRLTNPSIGIVTGINEAHLVSFKTLERTTNTIYEIADYVAADNLYQNIESSLVADALREGIPFNRKGVQGWKVSGVKTDVAGTSFTLKKGKKTVQASTQLLGKHNIGVTAAVVAIADSLGLTTKQIEAGLMKVAPFEHRMEPRFMHGAWVIDDTYNGNSEGVKAGLAFLKDQEAKRRIYVTPGLVEQGSATQSVHEMIGQEIARSNVDICVLMENSVTEFIKSGLSEGGFKGLLLEIDNPLEFYTNLDQFVAAGDLVLMQNDWTDNYQ